MLGVSMAEKSLSEGTGLPDWTSKEEKRGLDPLGMQTTSIALYQQLLPGMSNVTLRMRYYGFYAWLAKRYAKEVSDTSVERWCQYLRRAEALYALVAAHSGGEQGVAGTKWAFRKLAGCNGDVIDFSLSCDRSSGEPQYLKQKFGAFGAAYGSQLIEIGILAYVPGHDIPVTTEDIGESLADAFAAAIGELGHAFHKAADRGQVEKTELELLRLMLPSQIVESSLERMLYQDVLFGREGKKDRGAETRRLSLSLVLRAAQANKSLVNTNEVRWATYASRNQLGESLGSLSDEEEDQRFAWHVYHANDLLHAAYEALMKFSLDVLSVPPSGMPLEQLVVRVVSKLLPAMEARKAVTWRDLVAAIPLAGNPRASNEALSELSLANAIFEKSNVVGLSNEEWAESALLLLAVLHKRLGPRLAEITSKLPVLGPSPFIQSIVTELPFLEALADKPVAELLGRLIKQRVLQRHLWVAVQKFRSQGDYTFLLESDEGRMRVRQKDGPVLTNPRLSSAIAFLKDIHLLGPDGLTALGMEELEAA